MGKHKSDGRECTKVLEYGFKYSSMGLFKLVMVRSMIYDCPIGDFAP